MLRAFRVSGGKFFQTGTDQAATSTPYKSYMQLPSLSKRPAHTLLYITEVKTFRIDTDRKGVMSGEIQVIDIPCESANALPITVENIIEQSAGLGKTLWILYARLNTYLLSLPAVQVAGVDDVILQQALQFEYEALTGNSLSNSEMAYQFLGTADEMNSYWINSIASETLNDLMQKLSQSNCKLGGLCHPGGLPLLLSGADSASWLRVECWPTVVFGLSKNPEQGLTMQLYPNDADSNWQEQIDNWMLETGSVEKSEVLMNNQFEYVPTTDENFHLTLDGALIFWMAQWAQYLVSEESSRIPLFTKKTNINMELVYMVGGGLGALLLCSTHAFWMAYLTNDYSFQFNRLTKAEKELKNYRSGASKNRDKLTKLKQQVETIGDNVDVIPNALTALQQRPATLLKQLAVGSPADMLIEEIRYDQQSIVISGVSLQAPLCNILAGNIEQPLAGLGWKVNPPTKKEMTVFDNGGPWAFDMVIADLGLKGFIE